MALTGQFEKRVGIGQEGTWGVVGTLRAWIPFESEALGLPPQPLEPVMQTWSQRSLARTVQKGRGPAPEILFPLQPEQGIGEIMKGIFGTSSAAQFGTFGAYLHTFTVKNTAELASFFLRALEYGTFVYDYTGCLANMVSFEGVENDVIKVKVNFLGRTRVAGTAVTGTFGTAPVMTQHGNVTFKIDGTASTNVKRWKVDFNNNLTEHYVTGTGLLPGALTGGRMDVTGDFLLLVADETELNKFINKQASQLDIVLEAGTFTTGTMKYTTRFRLPSVEYTAVPMRMEKNVVGAAIAWRASYGTNGLGTGVVVGEVIDSVTSYD